MDTATQERLIPDKQIPVAPAKRCAFCGGHDVYQMDDKWICTDHLAALVSMAANDIWPDLVSYTREFETAVLM